MSEENELPEGWVSVKLEEICTIIMGQSPPSTEYNEKGEGLPFFQGKAEFTDLFPQVRKWCTAPTKVAEANDILLSVRAPVGPTNLAPSFCCIGRGLAAIRPAKDIQFRYVLYAIRAFNSSLTELGTGTTFAAVSGDDVKAFMIPLAPSTEQHRIVAAIEQQFTRLDASVAALQRARTKLKRYRAAVLKAAVEGKLTEAWRAEHPTIEPASMLLERILQERRAKWEADLRAKGKDPAKVKYVEPAGPDVESLPELPEEWCWANFTQISERVTVGHVGPMKDEYLDNGVPFLRGQNVRPNQFDPVGLKYISREFHKLLAKSALDPGDILVVRSGAVGTACVMPNSFREANCSDLVIVKRPISINPYYATYYMNSTAQDRVRAKQVGIALTHFNTQSMASMPLPLPPLAEQEQIVAEVERRLSVISALEATVEANLKRAERLRQSILREAFAGRLVPQDPNDEPASVLLERIRSERSEQSNGRKNGVGTSKNNKGRVVKVPESETVDVMGMEQAELWENVGN